MQLIFFLVGLVVPFISALVLNAGSNFDDDNDRSGIISLDFQVHQVPSNRKRGFYRTQDLINQQIYYTADIFVGSNKQKQSVLVDTGSSDLWIIDSNSCSSITEQCKESGVYDPRTSKSSVNLTTPFSILYLDQSSAEGHWFLDKVKIAGATIKNQQFANAHTITQGIGGDIVCGGTLGLGFKGNEVADTEYDNVPITLKKQGFIKKSAYSIYLNSVSAQKGSILFGGIDHAKYTGELIAQPIAVEDYLALVLGSVKVNDEIFNVHQPALLDTGSSWTYLPQEIADTIADNLNATWISSEDNEYYSVRCDNVIGNITYTFDAGASITVQFADLVFRDTDGNCHLGIGRAPYFILGDTFLRLAYAVFNLDDKTISLAQIKYTNKCKIRAIM